jgi:hypothetical protein
MDPKLKDAISKAGAALESSGFQNVVEQKRKEKFCTYHDLDLDMRGLPYPSRDHQPQIWCAACRRAALARPFQIAWFSVEAIRRWERDHPAETQVLQELRGAQ